MDNKDAKHLLLQVRRMCLEPYPFKEDDDVDTRYCLALGLIAGTCTEALQAVAQDRPMRLDPPSKEGA